jgi:hypothetical protein
MRVEVERIMSDASPVLGVLVTDMRFTRPPGDVASRHSYPHPVRLRTVPGVAAAQIVKAERPDDVLKPYLDGALALQDEGVAAITTTCGFLVLFQQEIASRLRVPFIASSLLQVPLVHALVQGRIGLITADARALSPAHLAAARADRVPMAIAGLEEYEVFAAPLLRDEGEIDLDAVESVVVATADRMLSEHPDIAAFVFECHNLAPFGAAVQRATGRPVYDVLSLLSLVMQGTSKPAFR